MAIINKGKAFSNGEQLTADKLNQVIDNATFTTSAVDNVSTQLAGEAIIVKDGGVTTAKLNNSAVATAKIADANVTFAKLTDVIDDDTMATASATKLATSESIKAYVDASSISVVTTDRIADANVTTAKIADANVTFAKLTDVIDDDTMATASDTTLATSESIKAYVDAIDSTEYNLKYSGSTGTRSVTTSFTDWDLSSVVGSNRAMVIIELWDSSTFISLIAKTKGSLVEPTNSSSFGGWGASGLALSSTNQGGTIAVITNELGVIEIKGTGSASSINYKIQAYQKLA